jgi:hypothetical protein
MNTIIKLNVKPDWAASRGHINHKSGAGVHHDRRLKRLKTRSAQKRAAFGANLQ